MPAGIPTATIKVGRTLYVDALRGSTSGDGTLYHPYSTITLAKTAATRGDFIYVRPGRYVELNLLKSFRAAITTATRTEYLATYNSVAHGFTAGDLVYLDGFADPSFNGEFTVETAAANSFTTVQYLEDGSTTTGVALGVLNYWFEPGAMIDYAYPVSDITPGGIFDDATAGAACWNRIAGQGVFRLTSFNTGDNSQAAIRLTQAYSRLEIDARSLNVLEDPAISLEVATCTFSARFASRIKNEFSSTTLIKLTAGANVSVEADKIEAAGLCISVGATLAHVRAREIATATQDGIAISWGGSGTTYFHANRIFGGLDITPNCNGFADVQEIVGAVDCSGEGTTNAEVRNAKINGVGLAAAPVRLTLTSGLTLRNVKVVADSGQTNSITCSVAETVKIMNVFANKAVGAGVTQQVSTVAVSTDVN